jgi:nicotinamidase-related amidase
MRDFEDYCWRDVVTEAELHIYSAYVRERAVGRRPALLVVHPGTVAAKTLPTAWTGAAVRLLAEARRRGMTVVHTLPPGATPLGALSPAQGEPVCARPCESAFFSTDLERTLTTAHAGSLIVCGAPTSGALRASVIEGKSFGYKVALAEEATGDESVFLHKIALFDLAHKYGDLMSLDELLEQLALQDHTPA